jgi:DNA-binding HxlR family transcriptional regulator
MTGRKKTLRSHCPINFALEVIGDKWSLLIVRDIAFWGKLTYGEFSSSKEKIASNILALRLERLLNEGVLAKTEDAADRRKDFYTLTEKGLDLIPLLLEMVAWSEKYDAGSEARKQKTFVSRIRNGRNKLASEIRKSVQGGGSVFGVPKQHVSQLAKTSPDS